MNDHPGRQLRIGTKVIGGEQVEFVWAPGTRFITAQFTGRTPRGIAHIDRIDTARPVVVPMSAHHDWLSDGHRTAALITAGRVYFTTAAAAIRHEISHDRPARHHPRAPTDRNRAAAAFMNARSDRARTP